MQRGISADSESDFHPILELIFPSSLSCRLFTFSSQTLSANLPFIMLPPSPTLAPSDVLSNFLFSNDSLKPSLQTFPTYHPFRFGLSLTIEPRYEILKERTREAGDMRGWSVHRRDSTEFLSYVVIASKLPKQTGERARSKLLESNQGRHSLTLSRQGMRFITVHAESGGDSASRDRRASQLQYLSQAHERVGGGACLLAGDFNLRPGEDEVLLDEGWRDSAWQLSDAERGVEWTWARGDFWARYDRVYIHAGVAKLAKDADTHMKVI